jgi:hypothetical protein
MKHLENAFKFILKNYIAAVPLFVALAIPALISQSGVFVMGGIFRTLYKVLTNVDTLRKPLDLIGELVPLFLTTAGIAGIAGIVGTLLKFAAMPATAGMVKKGVAGEPVKLDDTLPMIKEHLAQYVIYWVGNLVVSIVLAVVFLIPVVIFSALILLLKGFGVLLLFIVILAEIAAGIAVATLLSLWFPAMIIDNMSVVDAAKKSVGIVKKNFWIVLGITVLIAIVGGIASSIVNAIFGFIPLIGAVVATVVPALVEVVRMAFYFMFYRGETEGQPQAETV